MTDPLLQLLGELPTATPDPSRVHRIRMRCHAVLDRDRRKVTRSTPSRRRWPPIVVGLGGLYLTAVLHQVLALYTELSL